MDKRLSSRLGLAVFDVDGVLLQGRELVLGAADVLRYLGSKGLEVCAYSNVSGVDADGLSQKLSKSGISIPATSCYTSLTFLIKWLQEAKSTRIRFFGSDGSREVLLRNGLKICEEPGIPFVTTHLAQLNSVDVANACQGLERASTWITANSDRFVPGEGGSISTGCGMVNACLSGLTGRVPDVIVGKPNPYGLQVICQQKALAPDRILVIGDTPSSDIEMAQRAGCASLLVDNNGTNPSLPRTQDIISLLLG